MDIEREMIPLREKFDPKIEQKAFIFREQFEVRFFFFFLPHSIEWKGKKGTFASTHSLQSRVIRVPSDHRNPQVTGQLQKVLGAGRAAPILLVVHQVQDGRHVFREEVVAQRFQDL